MAKFTGVLLASDYDNTIVNTGAVMRGEIEEARPGGATLEALRYFTAHGGRFAVATGRALSAFASHAGELPMNAPAVLYNGAALYDFATGEYLETNYLNAAAMARAQEALDRWSALGAEAYNDALAIPAVQPNEITRRHQHLTHTGVEEFRSLRDIPGPVGKLLLEGDRATLEQARVYLVSQPWSGEYEIIFSGQNLLEMTARGSDKGSMVRRLAARLGISMEHVYCVGDETNDISMLTAAREGFAPANCVEAVRQCGATIVSDVCHDALADVIAILDKRYSE
ncbi:MAG: HAD-IIB family hydrolase [Oscillospiraceae bacterium]|nr:HAD-IIB family hydrolase [Oscillospiraceae bacterium]